MTKYSVAAVRPVILLVKAPVMLTAPSVVLSSDVVGPVEVLHTTPCSVGLGTPRSVTLPFPVAVVVVISVTDWVVTVGTFKAVKLTSPP